MSFFEELKRRNVFRVGIAYVISAWVLLQFVDLVLENIQAPDWVIKVFMLALAIGFPLAVFFAWAFEMTPDGVKRESEVDRSHSITPQTGRKLDRSIIIVLVLAVAFLLYRQIDAPTQTPSPATVAETASVAESSITNEAEGGPVTIAVLPFVNMSSDPEQEYFSDGITEEILNRLAKIRELQVAARTSVFSFKGQNQDIRQIGEMLGVGTILEGSVRRDGEQIRITAQLIRASDGFHLWSETYDRKLENIFAIQDDIASQIASALQISLGISAAQAGGDQELVNPEVYDLYLRARALHRSRGEGVAKAMELFRQALDIDPQFAPAWAGLAHSYNVIQFYASREDLETIGDFNGKSMAAAQKALELDPDLPTALHAMGNNLIEQFEWARAQEYHERALKLDPDSTDVMEDYANLLMYVSHFEKARKVAERMVSLDPYVPVFLLSILEIANTQGDFETRDKHLQKALEINADMGQIQYWELFRLLQYGLLDEAHNYVDHMDMQDWATNDGMHQLIDWMQDPDQPLNQEMRDAADFIPMLPLLAGRYDLWLKSTLRDPDRPYYPNLPTLWAPFVAPELSQQYHADPRTKELLQTLRLPEYWREKGWPDVCKPLGEDDFECH